LPGSCCPRLKASGYIDGTLAYIQKHDILAAERRKYFRCIQCGSDLDHHLDYKCQALQNILNKACKRRILILFGTVEMFREMREGEGYPKPLVLIIVLIAELVIVM
jgi:hypothetical protein